MGKRGGDSTSEQPWRGMAKYKYPKKQTTLVGQICCFLSQSACLHSSIADLVCLFENLQSPDTFFIGNAIFFGFTDKESNIPTIFAAEAKSIVK